MTDEVKNMWDVILNLAAMVGAVIGFVLGLRQWQRGQAWQRADKLDGFIEKFETDELLRLAAVVLDWTDRKIKYRERTLTVLNNEALMALRDHRSMETPEFPGEQATLRDAYDTLLAFLVRLELSISNGLIDAVPAKAYFAYWLERLVSFDRHPDKDGKILDGRSPETMVSGYIKAYSDLDAIRRLCLKFGVKENL